MRIINLAICDDNNDPKGLGRIRYKIYADNTAFKERAFDYEPWGDRDLFVANPFLPSNINFIPEVGQAVKIISYDTETEPVNPEYIAGPFSTRHDYNSQTFSQQIEDSSFGASIKKRSNVFSPNGKYVDNKSEGSFAKNEDYGIYGKYGSDILFTESGVQIRGGKLVSKENFASKEREKLLSTPRMSRKSSRIYLKKFPQKMTLASVEKPNTTTDNTLLNHIVEYTIDSLSSPTKVDFYVYKINSQPYGTTLYQTNNFNDYTDLYLSGVTLISPVQNISSGITYSITGLTTLKECYQEVRLFLQSIHDNGLKSIDPLFVKTTSQDLHPLYFRPTPELRQRSGNDIEKKTLLDNITLRRIGPGSGLIWSVATPNPPQKTFTEKVLVPKLVPGSLEQSFSAVISDKLYLLSTDTNEIGKSIHFDELDKYELTQEDYVYKIEPNTYSSVRGETLLELLRALIDVLVSHRHNINDPYARQDYPAHNRLIELYKKMENDILNRSIRIN